MKSSPVLLRKSSSKIWFSKTKVKGVPKNKVQIFQRKGVFQSKGNWPLKQTPNDSDKLCSTWESLNQA